MLSNSRSSKRLPVHLVLRRVLSRILDIPPTSRSRQHFALLSSCHFLKMFFLAFEYTGGDVELLLLGKKKKKKNILFLARIFELNVEYVRILLLFSELTFFIFSLINEKNTSPFDFFPFFFVFFFFLFAYSQSCLQKNFIFYFLKINKQIEGVIY